MFSVKDKCIVITGAGGVIGSTLSEALAKSGSRLCILDFNEEKLKMTEEKIRGFGGNHLAFTCNVFDVPALEKIKVEILKEFGRIDGLLNIAGGATRGASTKTEFLQKGFDATFLVFVDMQTI